MSLWHDTPRAWHEVLPGVRRRILAHSPSAMLVFYQIEPGRLFPRHRHPQAQYGTILSGAGVFVLGGRRVPVRAGDGYFVPPNDEHEFSSDPQLRTTILDVFTPEREDLVAEALPPDEP
ncbi:MAG TPA: cupin domain-containing protein [Thermoplasmata archaeon]|nr:cupin domain-containing protein [Thermoplasmata archaeon]